MPFWTADPSDPKSKFRGEPGAPAQVPIPVEGTVEPTPDPEPVIPDLVEPIIAWRCWDVTWLGYLRSLNGGGQFGGALLWKPRKTPQASCHAYVLSGEERSHKTGPRMGCRCGYYGAWLLADAQWPDANYAYGRVAMWGKVIEHEGGYRAEYAYPIEVILVAKMGFQVITRSVSNGVYDTDRVEIAAWTPPEAESIRFRMQTMYGVPVSIGTDDAMRDEWVAQYADMPMPPHIVPLLAKFRGEP